MLRSLARGEASLYGAIVMSVILVAFASLYSTAVLNLARQGEAYRESLGVSLEASRERIEFRQDTSGSIYAYSNTDSRIIYIVVTNSSSILYRSSVYISISPGAPAALLSGSLASLVSSGSASLIAFTSRGNAFTYRGGPLQGDSSGNPVSTDLWASPLLAIARQMGDLIYNSPGAYWISGDEAQGQVRVTIARSIVIGGGVTLYTADPTPFERQLAWYSGSKQGVWSRESRGGNGVTRVFIADMIIVNGTLSSRGLGGAGTIIYQDSWGNNQYTCNDLGGPYGQAGNMSSGGGGGGGFINQNNCPGLNGGNAYLYSYTAVGGTRGGIWVWTGWGYIFYRDASPGTVIDRGAFIKTLMNSPYSLLQTLTLYGAGGSSGGPGYPNNPNERVSGGPGGRGGGGIVIICNRLIMNNGVIDASGEDGGTPPYKFGGGGGGGGAGSMFIYCNSIEGSGAIKALGGGGASGKDGGGSCFYYGVYYYICGGGSGGRGGDGWVVIVTNSISQSIVIDAGSGYKVIATPGGG